MLKSVVLSTLIFSSTLAAQGQSPLSYKAFLTDLESDLLKQSIAPSQVKLAFQQAKLFRSTTMASHEKSQPVSLEEYLPTLVTQDIVARARQLFTQHRELLANIEQRFGVQPRFLIALWGIETNFSQQFNLYNAMSVVTSLAYQEQSPSNIENVASVIKLLATNELSHQQLQTTKQGRVGLLNLSPTQYLKGYTDFDDGVVNVWGSLADSLASTANYLSLEGWDKQYTWGRQVRLAKQANRSILASNQYRTLEQWDELGVIRYDGRKLPQVSLKARLRSLDGEKGRLYLTYQNFDYLTAWGGSERKALAVALLSDRIKFMDIK
ncbi:lytic transglycosylase domain-containing protein [Psychrobium sp. 1_MG-2023]|uniref:lytic murein transglycosylase n=1 Tax=Psychrobium sp. 1_MG-2023 TaxID=3062624 RepID=UPI000C322427|nr:lytic murein transglycosylase [Psychrobium sp. 1_MG-2023]MDP2562200.1 lytic murein transglycosylase [Psychrobium sp. 1_MG-2023]PKF58097.1 hypothetical protein CW748_04665 [Alteromonadales bacterium alter-6D02]